MRERKLVRLSLQPCRFFSELHGAGFVFLPIGCLHFGFAIKDYPYHSAGRTLVVDYAISLFVSVFGIRSMQPIRVILFGSLTGNRAMRLFFPPGIYGVVFHDFENCFFRGSDRPVAGCVKKLNVRKANVIYHT